MSLNNETEIEILAVKNEHDFGISVNVWRLAGN
jgi:hypothetical protein